MSKNGYVQRQFIIYANLILILNTFSGIKDELEKTRDEMVKAFKAKEFQKILDHHTEDAVVAFPGHEFIKKAG